LTLFIVISLLWLISGQAWEAHFEAIYCDPAPLADFSVALFALVLFWQLITNICVHLFG